MLSWPNDDDDRRRALFQAYFVNVFLLRCLLLLSLLLLPRLLRLFHFLQLISFYGNLLRTSIVVAVAVVVGGGYSAHRLKSLLTSI